MQSALTIRQCPTCLRLSFQKDDGSYSTPAHGNLTRYRAMYTVTVEAHQCEECAGKNAEAQVSPISQPAG